MESTRYGSRDLIFQITKFLPYSDQLEFRLVCKFWCHAICYGWKLQIIEYQYAIENTIKSIPHIFDENTIQMHKELVSTEQCINDDLAAYLDNLGQGSWLLSNFKQMSYMVKPNAVIQKPFYAAYVLLGYKLPAVTNSTNFDNKEELDQIWGRLRKWLKKKDFISQMKNFDVKTVNQNSVTIVK